MGDKRMSEFWIIVGSLFVLAAIIGGSLVYMAMKSREYGDELMKERMRKAQEILKSE
ncbi:MAG TPA: hypothetical protein PKL97_05855 [Candidatus Omnitrophota bacterium]|nr:hypothetical protein [Candidatus Omnitrophota bacterium]